MTTPAKKKLASGLGTLNLCTGGRQTVNVYADERDDPGRFTFYFDSHLATTVADDPDKWYVTPGPTMGTVVSLQITYNVAPTAGTIIWAGVFDGLSRRADEPAFIAGAPFYAGSSSNSGRTWTWQPGLGNGLPNVSCSATGVRHHVTIYKFRMGVATRDESIGFLAVPVPSKQ